MKQHDRAPEDLQRYLGLAIRQGRDQIGLSQEAFASVIGLHRTYIGSVERGERNISFQNLVRVATSLGQPVSTLVAVAEALQREVTSA